MIQDWYNDTFDVYRQKEILDENGNVVGTNEEKVGTVTGDLQQIDREKAEDMNLSFSKPYMFRCSTDEDITEGDKLKRNGEEYNVNGFKELNHPRIDNNHLEVILNR